MWLSQCSLSYRTNFLIPASSHVFTFILVSVKKSRLMQNKNQCICDCRLENLLIKSEFTSRRFSAKWHATNNYVCVSWALPRTALQISLNDTLEALKLTLTSIYKYSARWLCMIELSERRSIFIDMMRLSDILTLRSVRPRIVTLGSDAICLILEVSYICGIK